MVQCNQGQALEPSEKRAKSCPNRRKRLRVCDNDSMPMPSCALIKFTAQPAGVPETDHPKPDRLVCGDLMRETWNLVQADVTAGQVNGGV